MMYSCMFHWEISILSRPIAQLEHHSCIEEYISWAGAGREY